MVLPEGMHICVSAGSRAVKNSVATASSISSLLRLLTAASSPNFLRRCRSDQQAANSAAAKHEGQMGAV